MTPTEPSLSKLDQFPVKQALLIIEHSLVNDIFELPLTLDPELAGQFQTFAWNLQLIQIYLIRTAPKIQDLGHTIDIDLQTINSPEGNKGLASALAKLRIILTYIGKPMDIETAILVAGQIEELRSISIGICALIQEITAKLK